MHKLTPALCKGQHLQLWSLCHYTVPPLLHYTKSLPKEHVRWPLKATEVHGVPDQKGKFAPALYKFSLYLHLYLETADSQASVSE